MAFKRLTTAEMVSLTETWVLEGHADRKRLESIPDTKLLLPRIGKAHLGILSAQPSADPERLALLQTKGIEIDARHDDLVRCVHTLLTACAYLTRDPVRREALITLRDALFPTGLLINNASYREEAGQASMLKARLTPEHKTMLKQIPVPGGKLIDVLDEYFEVASSLRRIEDEKAIAAGEANGPAPSDMINARNAWIRVVNAVVANLELAEVDEETQTKILGPIRRAERVADLRAPTGGSDQPTKPRADNASEKAEGAKADNASEEAEGAKPTAEADAPKPEDSDRDKVDA